MTDASIYEDTSLICCLGSKVPSLALLHAGTLLRNGMQVPFRIVPAPNVGSSGGTLMGRQISVLLQQSHVVISPS